MMTMMLKIDVANKQLLLYLPLQVNQKSTAQYFSKSQGCCCWACAEWPRGGWYED